VKEGESLERLAQRYGIKVKTIQWANDLEDGGPIRPGDELLVLPTDGVLHNVSRGQTLSRIAQLYDIDSDVIAKQNDISGGFILAGQELIIPGGTPIVGKPVIIATVDPSPDVDIVDRPDTPTTTTDDDVVTDTADIAVLPTPPRGVEATPTAGVLQKPCSENCFYTQYYRPGHYAVDMQERGGGPIYAAEAGTVIRSEMGWNGGFGNVIEVDHGNGLVTLYAHNKELYVKKGETVYRGQNISWMGNSGLVYGKTGIHVHFEVRLHGVKKNPIYYIE
jgi:murein DD-endopeptidase MepM/ murein hydrolase activator NlpD